jgi:hypothetical protein
MDFSFSTATMVTRTLLDVMLCLHCLSCLIKEVEVFGNQFHEVAKRKILAHAGDRNPVAELASISVNDV